MNCPFLRETPVRYCRRGPRILIPRGQPAASERCNGPAFAECPVYLAHPEDAHGAHCPLLEETLMQYCSAAAITKFVPYSEAILSRCGSGSYEYCDLYLDLAKPAAVPQEDEIEVGERVRYTRNHLWLDLAGEGQCHIGIDAFLARMFGKADGIGYLTPGGTARPAAVVRVGGVDFPVTFPARVALTGCNLYLRAEPARLTASPYTSGWLFEADLDRPQRARFESQLMSAGQAHAWMEAETRRMNESLQSRGGALRADGGVFARGVLSSLAREDALRLFHEFCPPSGAREDDIA